MFKVAPRRSAQASTNVLGALIGRRVRGGVEDTFEQALTIVYRILFLLFAEARGLVPLWHPIYRQSYSLDALRITAERSRQTPGLWDALRAVGRLAHSGCHAGDLHVTPFNGRLFAPSRTPLAERRDLDDDSARRALLALATRPTADRAGGRARHTGELEQPGAVSAGCRRACARKGVRPQITPERPDLAAPRSTGLLRRSASLLTCALTARGMAGRSPESQSGDPGMAAFLVRRDGSRPG